MAGFDKEDKIIVVRPFLAPTITTDQASNLISLMHLSTSDITSYYDTGCHGNVF